jgi:hypothetical protein
MGATLQPFYYIWINSPIHTLIHFFPTSVSGSSGTFTFVSLIGHQGSNVVGVSLL